MEVKSDLADICITVVANDHVICMHGCPRREIAIVDQLLAIEPQQTALIHIDHCQIAIWPSTETGNPSPVLCKQVKIAIHASIEDTPGQDVAKPKASIMPPW